jgi:hypothetical protein
MDAHPTYNASKWSEMGDHPMTSKRFKERKHVAPKSQTATYYFRFFIIIAVFVIITIEKKYRG